MTKEQLAKIYKDLTSLENDRKLQRAAVHRAQQAILRAADEADFRTIEELVNQIRDSKNQIAGIVAKRDKLHAELKAAGYTMNDARYYATGARPEYFGGGLVPIKSAE